MDVSCEEFLGGKVTLYGGDCLDVLDTMPAESVDAVVTDPPYHLTSIVKRFGGSDAAPAMDYSGDPAAGGPARTGAYARSSRGFMGKQWDGGDIAFRVATWSKVLRVLKPGGHLLAFSAPRNFGHLQIAIEAAGFETRDCILDLIESSAHVRGFVASLDDTQRAAFIRIVVESSDVGGLLAWIFGTGFPKSHNIALDFEKSLCRKILRAGVAKFVYVSDGADMRRFPPFRDPRANAWSGTGTALKPGFEPIVLARKPCEYGLSIAENVEKYGTGALNIDGCRIAAPGGSPAAARRSGSASHLSDRPARVSDAAGRFGDRSSAFAYSAPRPGEETGRWPANVITDDNDSVRAGFPETASGELLPHHRKSGTGLSGSQTFRIRDRTGEDVAVFGDRGSARRFFYSHKADADDRIGSRHPTIKPVDLMRYLVRLVTVPGQIVLDPFAGTGTTGEAAFVENRRAVLIEREQEYRTDIVRRMHLVLSGPDEKARAIVMAKGELAPPDGLPLFGGDEPDSGGGAVGAFTECSPMKTESRGDD